MSVEPTTKDEEMQAAVDDGLERFRLNLRMRKEDEDVLRSLHHYWQHKIAPLW